MGRRGPPNTAGATYSTSARTLEMASSTPVFMPCRTPNRANATQTWRNTSAVRTGLRRMPDQIKGKYFKSHRLRVVRRNLCCRCRAAFYDSQHPLALLLFATLKGHSSRPATGKVQNACRVLNPHSGYSRSMLLAEKQRRGEKAMLAAQPVTSPLDDFRQQTRCFRPNYA